MASDLTGQASDEELSRLGEAIQEQRVELREYLAQQLGGEPDDYRAETWLAEHG